MNEKGFTLIEMLIVLAVISTLLILLIPNLAEKNSTLQDQSCTALQSMAEGQLVAYEVDTGEKATDISQLVGDYLQSDTCANGSKKLALSNGVITIQQVNNVGDE